MKKDEEDKEKAEAEEEVPNKEVASENKLSLGEAISKATDQEIRPSAGVKEQYAQAWEEHMKAKKSKTE